MNLGGKYWLFAIGGAIACWIGGMALFLLLEGAWYRWGFLGMLLFISAILLGFGWWYDRRHPKRYDDGFVHEPMDPRDRAVDPYRVP